LRQLRVTSADDRGARFPHARRCHTRTDRRRATSSARRPWKWVPKTAGRLEEMFVRLGDRVSRGQQIARIEDREIREQVKQAEAAFQVARATIRQREADLKFAETNVERSRNLFDRRLLPKQSLEDAEARYQANDAQLDLARAQFGQAQSRLEGLRLTLANKLI